MRSAQLVGQRFQLFCRTRNQNKILLASGEVTSETFTEAARGSSDKGEARLRFCPKLV
jgi:hypothetical protein